MKPEYPAILRATLWSAYGDALGFISELTDERGLLRRAGTHRLKTTVSWVRRVGGELGADIRFPAGTYSDDTQLRLATCRAIRANGMFDVEAFAKIELPVWPSYALGAGRGTKTAAAALAAYDVNWYSNFFDRQEIRYVNGGGNGAAMRIQPHIWASPDPARDATWIRDVLRNSICTHGHPRGFLGAVFHAYCLAYTATEGKIPDPVVWKDFAHSFLKIPSIIAADQELSTFWLPTWESTSGQSLSWACEIAATECLDDINVLLSQSSFDRESAYRATLHSLDGFDPRRRGDGIRTALFAVFLSHLFQNEESPAQALEIAVNCVGSDTDSIATMAGALLGQLATNSPPAPILDISYLTESARLLHNIANGKDGRSFNYPDLMHWTPPKAQQDAVVLFQNQLQVLGLGPVQEVGEEFSPKRKQPAIWQRLVLSFGQTVFIKRRLEPTDVPFLPLTHSPSKPLEIEQPELVRQTRKSQTSRANNLPSVDELTDEAIAYEFDPLVIGKHILLLADQPEGIELTIAYGAIIAKARRARLRRDHRRQ